MRCKLLSREISSIHANFLGQILTPGKTVSFQSSRKGFESVAARLEVRGGKAARRKFDAVIIGMELTGGYWQTLSNCLIKAGYQGGGVNPYHTKRAGDFVRLVKDGTFFDSIRRGASTRSCVCWPIPAPTP
ncbi:MAG: IS110 family transposase [Clostridiales bacterium]|nr:IS110 family transposase [Clostridiales bacterium]